MIKAKIKVDEVTLQKDEKGNVVQEQVTASPVISGSEENKSFAESTPSGRIELSITNPSAFGFFIQGLEYIVDFTKAQ